jgi:hypothetical protein
MQGSLETPLRGDPKAAPWEQWEALEHKNKPARPMVSPKESKLYRIQ